MADAPELAPVYGPPADPVEIAPRTPVPIAIPTALDRAASIATATHPVVAAADAEADALTAELRGARRGRYPNLSAELLAATSGSSIADQDGLALNAVIEQPVWAGGRIDGAIRRARASLRAGDSRVDQAQRRIVERVIAAYYDYVQADERAAVLQNSLAKHRDLLGSIQRRVQQEVSPQIDFTLGRSRTTQVEVDLTATRELRAIARLQLTELTDGADIDPTLPPISVARTVPPEDVALIEAYACDPSLAVLTNQIAIAEADSELARAQLLLQVLLQLSQNEITGTRAAAVLRMRLGNGAAELTGVDSADARILRAIAEFGEAQRRAREELQRIYIRLRASSARIAVNEAAADAADQIVASYRRQFIAGRRNWLDVMNAVREAADARLAESDARVTAALGAAQIMALTCRWQPDTPDAVS
ncbi:MAG: TolC family protein [Pontixanthobacter sp.]